MKKENSVLVSLYETLNKDNRPIWKKIAAELCKARRSKTEVNLNKLDTFATDGKTLIVPGKVLGSGILKKKVHVAAFAFSESAKKLILHAGGKVMSIEALYSQNPSGDSILIIK